MSSGEKRGDRVSDLSRDDHFLLTFLFLIVLPLLAWCRCRDKPGILTSETPDWARGRTSWCSLDWARTPKEPATASRT